MKSFLVIGLGRFGSSVANNLYELGNEVLALDKNPALVQQISPNVTDAASGDACDINVLRAIDAHGFDCAVVAISADMEASILITYHLKSLGVKTVVAKAANETHEDILRKIGADKVVIPEKQTGLKVAQELSSHDILDFLELSGDISIIEIPLPKKWAGKSLRELDIRKNFGVNTVAVRPADGDFIVNVDPDRPFEEADTVVVIGENSELDRIKK